MAYVEQPEPADDVVIVPAHGDMPDFTWGMHRQINQWLREAEEDDPAVKAARERLDSFLEKSGLEARKYFSTLVCEHCGRTEVQSHEPTCPDWEEPPQREAAGYQYRDASFNVIHVTSIPATDEEAMDYCRIVAVWFNYKGDVYVEARRFGEGKHKMIPFVYNTETREVKSLEQAT